MELLKELVNILTEGRKGPPGTRRYTVFGLYKKDDDEHDGYEVKHFIYANSKKEARTLAKEKLSKKFNNYKVRRIQEDYSSLTEKWKEPAEVAPSEKGKHSDKSVEELRSQLAKAKKAGNTSLVKELNFAIRAKTGWGKVNK